MLRLRMRRPLSIAFLVVGALAFVVGIVTTGILQILLGALLVLLGVLTLVNPSVVLADGEFQTRNPLGMTLRRFPVRGPHDVRIEGTALVHAPTGKRIASLGALADQSDVQQIRAWAQGTTPAA